PSPGRHDDRLYAVANIDLENALGVLQFGNLDQRFALATDVHEGHVRTDRHDRALDGLTLLDALRLNRSLEHRGEIFVGFAHGMPIPADLSARGVECGEHPLGPERNPTNTN